MDKCVKLADACSLARGLDGQECVKLADACSLATHRQSVSCQ